VVKTCSRRSRIVVGIALLAASAAVSTAMLGAARVLAEVRSSPALVSAVPLWLAEHAALPPFLPLAKRTLSEVRRAASVGARLLPPAAAHVAASQAPLAMGLLGGLIAGVAFGGWLLDFARRNSRTRGQPRLGEQIF
jgi:hypothetical protein